MRKVLLGLLLCLPLPALALDVEAISRGLVEASPWGKNADILPVLLAWFGLLLLVAVLLKLVYSAFDSWRSQNHVREVARQQTDQWVLEVGELLKVPPPMPCLTMFLKGLNRIVCSVSWRFRNKYQSKGWPGVSGG